MLFPKFEFRLPTWASVWEDVFSPTGTRCPRVGWYPRGRGSSPFSEEKGRELYGEGFVRMDLGGEERMGL